MTDQRQGSLENSWISLTPPSFPRAIQSPGVQGAPQGRTGWGWARLVNGASEVGTPTLGEDRRIRQHGGGWGGEDGNEVARGREIFLDSDLLVTVRREALGKCHLPPLM